jgi:hypothetical protein
MHRVSPSSEPARGDGDVSDNPLLAFDTESGKPSPRVIPRSVGRKPVRQRPSPIAVLAIVLAVAAVVAGTLFFRGRAARVAATPLRAATLTISTTPPGADVFMDGQSRGATPISFSAPAGAHVLTLRRGQQERTLPITLESGVVLNEDVELPESAAAERRTGTLVVVTDPPDARVDIDGRTRGRSPIRVADLPATTHKVLVTTGRGSSERVVDLAAGATTSVVFSLPQASAPIIGWVAVTAPFTVDITDNDALVATGREARIPLSAGVHVVHLTNDTLGYQDARRIEVAAGKTSTLRVDAPKAPVSVNARPWADVLVDGMAIGQTPIANFQVAIGEHEITFRHPQFADTMRTIVVTERGPNRVVVDLTAK